MLSMTFLQAFFTGDSTVFAYMASLSIIFTTAVFSAWYFFGREIITFRTMCAVPIYMLRKIPLYFSFLIKRQKDWVKTERH